MYKPSVGVHVLDEELSELLPDALFALFAGLWEA